MQVSLCSAILLKRQLNFVSESYLFTHFSHLEKTYTTNGTRTVYIYMNVPMYLLAQNIHGPRFTSPFSSRPKIYLAGKKMAVPTQNRNNYVSCLSFLQNWHAKIQPNL